MQDQCIKVDPGHDHIVYLSTTILKTNICIETATVLKRMGNSDLAASLLIESWHKLKKQELNRLNFVAKVDQFDYVMGSESYRAWVRDPHTYENLGNYFKSHYNLVFAAEMFGHAAELCSDGEWVDLSKTAQKKTLQLVLDRAECLAEVAAYVPAEFCAHFAYGLKPQDIVVVGRAARCCRPGVKKNEKLLLAAKRVGAAVLLVQTILRMKVTMRLR